MMPPARLPPTRAARWTAFHLSLRVGTESGTQQHLDQSCRRLLPTAPARAGEPSSRHPRNAHS